MMLVFALAHFCGRRTGAGCAVVVLPNHSARDVSSHGDVRVCRYVHDPHACSLVTCTPNARHSRHPGDRWVSRVYIAFRLAEPERFLEPDGFEDLVSLIANLKGGESVWVPTVWAVEVLIQAARAETTNLVLSLGLLYAGAASLVTLGTWLARVILTPSFMTAQEGQVARHRSDDSDRSQRMTTKPTRYPTGVSSAIRQRDLRIFLRTTGQWTQLLLVGALVVVYLFNFKHFRALQDTGLLGRMGIFYINYALGGLVITTLVARFLYPSVSLKVGHIGRFRSLPFSSVNS